MLEVQAYESNTKKNNKNCYQVHCDPENQTQSAGIIPMTQKKLSIKELNEMIHIEKLEEPQNKSNKFGPNYVLDYYPNQNNKTIGQVVDINDENRWPVEKISNKCQESQKVYCLGCSNEVYTDVESSPKLLLLLIMVLLVIPFIFCACKDFVWRYKHKCCNCKRDVTYYEDKSYFCASKKN